jgi:hypothetical protein
VTTRLRALPLTPPPVHRETIGSYLNRLADADHLTIGHLLSLIGPSRQHRRVDNRVGYWTPAARSRLAFLTGRSASLLVRAMPPLGAIGDPSLRLPRSDTEEVTEPRRRPACRLCMARRHIPRPRRPQHPTPPHPTKASAIAAGSSGTNSTI